MVPGSNDAPHVIVILFWFFKIMAFDYIRNHQNE